MKPFDFSAGSTPGRQTVVLLHSSASSARQWTALVDLLSSRFDVRAVDFHGHGTQAPWSGGRPLTLADEVALIEPILQAAGRVHLVGHSYGGAVALKVAEMFPHSVRSLVVYEPVLFNWLFRDDANSQAAQQILAVSDAVSRYLAAGLDHAAGAVFVNYWSGAGAWEWLPLPRRDAIAARMRAVHPHFGALYSDGLSGSSIGRTDMPILYLTGADTPESSRRIAELAHKQLPRAEHETLAGMGHLGPITHAAAINRRIEQQLVDRGTADVIRETIGEAA